MNLVNALLKTLEELPGEEVTLLALADHYLDLGQPDVAECLRWTVAQQVHPFRYVAGSLAVAGPTWNDGWFWWARQELQLIADWGHPRSCRLPTPIWKLMRHTFAQSPLVFKEYPTLQSAYEALFEVWPLTSAHVRQIYSWGNRR